MAQVPPNKRIWAASFCAAWELVPGPQLEQVPSKFNLQTSQLIPQAPVGIAQSFRSLVQRTEVRRQKTDDHKRKMILRICIVSNAISHPSSDLSFLFSDL
jgi:hypothetical protein